MTAILELDALSASALCNAVGDFARAYESFEALSLHSGQHKHEGTIVLGPSIDSEIALEFAAATRRTDPTLGVVLVRQRIDANLLAAALRVGVREVVAERDLVGLAEAVRCSDELTLALRSAGGSGLEDEPGGTSGRVVTIWSPKGGCGKTTLAVNIAVDLASLGHSVALIDLDLAFGDVAISLGLRPDHGFEEAAAMGHRLDRVALQGLLTEHESGMHVLSPPNDPGVAERVSTSLVSRIVEVARSTFDYVVIDTAPMMDERNITMMEASDVVLLVTTLDVPSLKNLRVGIDTLRLINYPQHRLNVVLNRADAKVGLNSSEVERSLGICVAGKVPSSRDVPVTTNRGVAIVAESPKHQVSTAITTLTRNAVLSPEHAAPTRRGGLLKRRR